MTYILLFMEGILTFLSPCLLPMIPLYFAYFTSMSDSKSILKEALQFVIGFSIVFVAMSVFVTTIGQFVFVNRQIIQIVTGTFMVLLGIDQLLGQRFSKKLFGSANQQASAPMNPFLFGILFAMSWTPCVGVYLASAMALAMNAQHQLESIAMMTTYTLGLAIPFLLSALFIQESKEIINKIKPQMALIQKVSAIILIIFGLLIATGYIFQIIPT